MNIDEEEWEYQERALEDIRTGNVLGHESPRLLEYRILMTILARQTIPALSEDFAHRVSLLTDLRSEKRRRLDRRFESGLAAAMLMMLALVAFGLSACFGTEWLKPVIGTDPWLEAFLVCLVILSGTRYAYKAG
jgi:nitroreductase